MTKTRDEILNLMRDEHMKWAMDLAASNDPFPRILDALITAGVIPQWRPITVTLERDYGECGHEDAGCSGWESIEVIATDGVRTESHKQAGCFGTSEIECFEYVMNKWNRVATPPQNNRGDE
jgi:hypothetical protein